MKLLLQALFLTSVSVSIITASDDVMAVEAPSTPRDQPIRTVFPDTPVRARSANNYFRTAEARELNFDGSDSDSDSDSDLDFESESESDLDLESEPELALYFESESESEFEFEE